MIFVLIDSLPKGWRRPAKVSTNMMGIPINVSDVPSHKRTYLYKRELSLTLPTSKGTCANTEARTVNWPVVAMPRVVSSQDSRSVAVDMLEMRGLEAPAVEEVHEVSYGRSLFQHDCMSCMFAGQQCCKFAWSRDRDLRFDLIQMYMWYE